MLGRRQDDDSLPSEGKVSLGQRLKRVILKPAPPGADSPSKPSNESMSVDELEATVRYADDKERLIGLTAAPLAAILGLAIISALISNDPPALLKGQPNKLHVGVGTYHELLAVLLALSVAMLITALYRKRLFLGIATAMYGLAVFNLHYWGFGIPFVMIGAWLLVRAYRFQRSLREATGDLPGRGRNSGGGGPPRASRRYTPPSSPKRSISSDPKDERRAG
jgi:hypothetical protein